jgi:hypothetical protein
MDRSLFQMRHDRSAVARVRRMVRHAVAPVAEIHERAGSRPASMERARAARLMLPTSDASFLSCCAARNRLRSRPTCSRATVYPTGKEFVT